MNPTPCQLVFCTCPNPEIAEQLATLLVEQRLAACINIIPGLTSIYRWQGLTTLTRVQASLQHGELPAQAMLEGLLLLLAGALLLTPGFVTDAFGFLILVPPLRHHLAGWLLQRGLLQAGMPPRSREQPPGHRTIEGEYKKRDD